jgi:hypothetical protein
MYSSYSLLTSAQDGDEWSASRPGRALSPERDPRAYWIGWLVLRSGLYTETKEKSLCLRRGSKPGGIISSFVMKVKQFTKKTSCVDGIIYFFVKIVLYRCETWSLTLKK